MNLQWFTSLSYSAMHQLMFVSRKKVITNKLEISILASQVPALLQRPAVQFFLQMGKKKKDKSSFDHLNSDLV